MVVRPGPTPGLRARDRRRITDIDNADEERRLETPLLRHLSVELNCCKKLAINRDAPTGTSFGKELCGGVGWWSSPDGPVTRAVTGGSAHSSPHNAEPVISFGPPPSLVINIQTAHACRFNQATYGSARTTAGLDGPPGQLVQALTQPKLGDRGHRRALPVTGRCQRRPVHRCHGGDGRRSTTPAVRRGRRPVVGGVAGGTACPVGSSHSPELRCTGGCPGRWITSKQRSPRVDRVALVR